MFLWWIPWCLVALPPLFAVPTQPPPSALLLLQEGAWRRFAPDEGEEGSPRILRELRQNFRKRSIRELYRPLGHEMEPGGGGGPVLASPLSMRSLERALEESGSILAGMGGSALQSVGSSGGQRFATQPAPQTAVIGSTAVLPCR